MNSELIKYLNYPSDLCTVVLKDEVAAMGPPIANVYILHANVRAGYTLLLTRTLVKYSEFNNSGNFSLVYFSARVFSIN